MRDLIFVALFLAMLPMALRFGHVATMVWAWVALAGPSQFMFGFASDLSFNKVVAFVAVVAFFVDYKRRPAFYVDSHGVLLLAFLLVGMTSYMFGLSGRTRADDLADRIFKIVVLSMFIVMTIRTRLHIHSLLIAIGLGMGIHGAIEATKFVATGGSHVLVGPMTIGDNNHFGLAILMVLPLLAYLYLYSVSILVRVALALAILANVAAVIASNSRGALIALVVVGFAVFIQSRHKLLAAVVLLILGGVGAALAPDRWYDRMSSIGAAGQDSSFMGRIASWKMNLLVALDRPLTGGGFSAMEDPTVFNLYLPRFSSLDFIPTHVPTSTAAAHSIYFQVLGDTGFIGFSLFVGLLFVAFRNVRSIQRLSRDREDLRWAADLGRFLRLTLIAYTVGGAALSLAYFELYYIVITLISVTRRHVQDAVRSVAPQGSARLALAPRAALGGMVANPPTSLGRSR